MAKLDSKKLLADAEAAGQVYRIKPGWRRMNIFAGVLCCLLVITIPVGIWMFVTARRARIALADEGFVVVWFTTNAYRWEDIELFQPVNLNITVSGAGLVGALVGAGLSAAVAAKTQGLKGPLSFKLKGKRMARQMPAHAVADSVAMAEEMERRTGLTIFPAKEPVAQAEAAT